MLCKLKTFHFVCLVAVPVLQPWQHKLTNRRFAVSFPLLCESQVDWGSASNCTTGMFLLLGKFLIVVNASFLGTSFLSRTFSKTGKYLSVAFSAIVARFFSFASVGEKGNTKINSSGLIFLPHTCRSYLGGGNRQEHGVYFICIPIN